MMVERKWPTCISLARFGAETPRRCAAPDGLAHADVGVGQGGVQAGRQGVGVLEEVQEARAGDFGGLGDIFVSRQRGDDFFR